jgi:3-isopropylmalate dehydrogenase
MAKNKYKILIIPGDGVGPEITESTKQVLDALSSKFDFLLEYDYGLIGHAAIKETGQALPQETLEKAGRSDAILFGAVGDPLYDKGEHKVRPEQGLLAIRKSLNLFANLRPIKLFDSLLHSSPLRPEILKGTDILFFRELTGGIYFGTPRERRENGTLAVDTALYSVEEIRRIAVMSFEAAQKRRKKVTSVDKANVLETSRLWREVVEGVAKDYPEVHLEHQLVDSMAMKLISSPSSYDVVLTENLFGDILTDEASQIAGSIGLLPSASVGSQISLYEPIHGSAPDIAGQDKVNPLATILSAALMLEMSFDQRDASNLLVKSVNQTLEEGYRTVDLKEESSNSDKILGTQEMTAKIVEKILLN